MEMLKHFLLSVQKPFLILVKSVKTVVAFKVILFERPNVVLAHAGKTVWRFKTMKIKLSCVSFSACFDAIHIADGILLKILKIKIIIPYNAKYIHITYLATQRYGYAHMTMKIYFLHTF